MSLFDPISVRGTRSADRVRPRSVAAGRRRVVQQVAGSALGRRTALLLLGLIAAVAAGGHALLTLAT